MALLAALVPTALVPAAAAAQAAPAPPPPPSDRALAAQPARHDLTREQYYFVLPDRFANGDKANDLGGLDGDRLHTGFDPADKGFYQGGDLKGLTRELDYIKGLGTTAIWMAPIFKNKPVQGEGKNASAGYHGYWITDFTRVDPHFGTNADLKKLISKAHAKGMKVFFDVITNHTADTVDYAEKAYGYRSKGAYPYLDREGRPFDDRDGMKAVDADAFPYTPRVTSADKVPAWLNDPAMYHNRGDSTFAGESSEYGDFSGLDDLWTERPEVVRGMERIYRRWVRDFAVDGFRIDTVKHVDLDFWTQWATALDAYAAKHGRRDFFMFGEIFDGDPEHTSPYVTRGRLDATLDFPFQQAARSYASQGGSAQALAKVFAQDYRYTTDKANAYEQVTFLGNHDMGRVGAFVAQDNAEADDAALLRRDRFAHELMFLTRGQPVVYYGDEQGFTGAGGDKDARQTLFASRTPDYLDDDEIGTDRTHADDAYDPEHPLYRAIAKLSELTKDHPALRDGVQEERYAAEGAGVYAFSRTGLTERVEYVVAVNNAAEAKKVSLPTHSARMPFTRVYGGEGGARATTGADRALDIEVPPLSAVVYQADKPLAQPSGRPSITLTAPEHGATGTVEISADVPGGGQQDGSGLDRVVFAAQTGSAKWKVLGSADHAPYRVTQDLSKVSQGTPLRYKAVVVDTAGHTAHALASSTAGQAPLPDKPSAVQRDWAIVHYKRPGGDYDGWQLKSGQTASPFTGRDAYGAFAWVKVGPDASKVPFTVEKDGTADGPERAVEPARTGEVWIEQGKDGLAEKAPDGAYPPQDTRTAVLHYHRADGDYDGWGLHTWTGAAEPTDWSKPLQPASKDAYGVTFKVPLADGAGSLSYIVHKGDQKDLPSDQSLDFGTYGHEVWLLDGQPKYLLPSVGGAPDTDLSKARAQWIDRNTVAWKVKATDATSQQLVYAPQGGVEVKDGDLTDPGHWLRLIPVPGGLTEAQRAAFPHLKDHPAFTVDPRDRDRVRTALTGQVIATQRRSDGALTAATGVQIPGVLDDLYGAAAATARLGPVFHGGRPSLSVWAPTAQRVALELDGHSVAMHRDDATGVWKVSGEPSWKGKPYRYLVTVWAPAAHKVVTNKVTDPYSVALTADSARSLVVDLDDPGLAPKGWSGLRKPPAVPLTRAQIQELHIRDFSVADRTSRHPGQYLAFTDKGSAGVQHLRRLAKAGTTHLHLLPAFDFSTVPERRADQAEPDCDLASMPPDSAEQQKCVTATAAEDAYNWGYDPLHYTVPEGSYASDPQGPARTVEFRRMVQGINGAGLRTVMDVVYNHTSASGQDPKSVLDRIVPGYYHRLLDDGKVADSTCCANTAPEHTMMGKLVVDSVVTWAKEYKVDGFRFDLMGHHPKANILAVRKALDALTPAKDGVDGTSIVLYGEGWNFGEVADDTRFVQATQKNMAGTGVATFDDRSRDAVRGGGPFDEDPRKQGFGSGLYTDPNGAETNGSTDQQRAALLHAQDLIKLGLSGNLRDFTFTDSSGKRVRGSEVDYNGAPAGYAADPGDALSYVDAHDNETLYDALAYKLPRGTSAADRSRMQVLSMATAALSQGPALSQAGTDLLRSKSLDRNSFDSGDWFNAIHWNCRDGNGFGRGLPPAADNGSKWPFAGPLLGDSALRPDCGAIEATSSAYRDLLRIRSTEKAFGLTSAADVQDRLSFPLSGKDETPGVITMRLDHLVVVFNATPKEQEQKVPDLAGRAMRLHPVQADGSDAVVKRSSYEKGSGTFTVPARTVAVFTDR
ncbi:pullulanase-type alpha-1,6-glucosidase [Wenjunlia tyrosinilytica]|nr:pullulanase-type alpha-1,6-glucosidase [Wenjunlia tyrosinilytica]